MKKLLITIAFTMLFPSIVLAQTVASQSTLIIAPYGGPGFIVSTTTANGGKLQASSTPFFARFYSLFGSSTALSATTLCLTGDTCRTTWPSGTVDTGTFPISVSGSVISSLFSTTTTWGLGNNGLVMTGATGIPFSQATSSAINLNISGNAGTVTNGVYTTTFNSLFDPRFVTDLAATTSVASITTLPFLSLPASQVSFGTPTAGYVWSYQNGAWGAYATSTGGGGTVTSVATGEGLSGGTITTSGTLVNPFVIATTTGLSISQIPYFTKTSGQTTFGGVATGTISASGPLSVTAGRSAIGGAAAFSISQSGSGTDGYLSSTDWNTFNNKGSGTLTSVSGTYPVISSGGTTPAISLAFGTTTTNTWSNLQTFTSGLNFNATSTGTFGINLTGGCYALGGACLTAGAIGGGSTQAVNWATTAVLAGTPTYSNGTAGVGATLTEVGTGALSVDSNSPAAGDRVLVKNQASALQNGIYVVTATGSGIASYILTRATDYNSPTEITPGINTYVLSGTANTDTTWAVSFTPPLVIGTNSMTYTESAGTNGTVTSVAASVPSFLSISGSPVTTSGTLAIGYSGTALPIANGGTNATSFGTANGITAYNSTSLVNFSGYTLTGSLLTATNASTTQLTVGTGLQIPNSSNPASLQTGYVAQSTNSPFQLRAGSAVFDPRTSFTFGIATSTAWTASTTAPTITIPTGLTWNSISCLIQPAGATLEVQYQYANPTTFTTVNTFLNASSTNGVTTLSSNNTPATNATSTITFGNPTGSPTSASCTLVGTVAGI